MTVFRSFRAVGLAALAAVVAFVWATRHGAPSPFARAGALGADPLHARGGVVIDLTLHTDDPRARETAMDVIEQRLARLGDVTRDGDRMTVLDVDPDRAGAVTGAAELGGVLQFALVDESPEITIAISDARPRFPSDVTPDVDEWVPEDSNQQHRAAFLSSRDPASLRRAVALLPASIRDRVVYELVRPEPSARDLRPYWRSYVLVSDRWAINSDIARAGVSWDPNTNKPIVQLDFTGDGGRRFGELTSANVGRKMAILLDGHVNSAPIINGPIRGGAAVITMGGNDPDQLQDEADDLVATLKAGVTIPFAVDATVVDTHAADPARLALGRSLFALAATLCVLVIAWPLVRWRAIARAPASARRPAVPSRWAALVPRALVTVGVIAVLVGLAHVVAPGVDLSALPPGAAMRPDLSLAAIGVAPILFAYLAMELYGLVDRRSRAKRNVGLTVMIATAVALIEAWFHASYLSSFVLADPLVPPDARWEVAAAMVGGVALYALGAIAIDRWGLGRGWSAVLAVDVIRALSDGRGPIAWRAWLYAGALAAVVLVAARSRAGSGTAGRGVRLPFAGFAGAAVAPLVIPLLWRPLQFVLPVQGYRVFAALDRLDVAIAIAVAVTALFAWLGSRRLAGADRARAIGLDVAIAALLTAAPFALGVRPWIVVEAAIAGAALLDALAEARARARGAWSAIAEVHDVGAADDLLDGATAPRLARGMHVRALLRGLGPMVPIEVIEAQSPEQQALEASLAPARVVAE